MKTSRSYLAGAFALLLLAACGGSSNGLTVLLKDAPAGFNAAVVTISEVALEGSSGTVVLRSDPITTDLLTLANDTATLVKDAVVPPGHYSQLRFVITGGYIDVGGAIYASASDYAGLPAGATVAGLLQMPSYAQSGLKVDLPGGKMELGSEQKILVVDFDVSQSFGQQAGGSGTWAMHPVIKATDVVMTGAIDVTFSLGTAQDGSTLVLPAGVALTDFSVVLTPAAGGDGVTAALADDGTGKAAGVSFKYLAPGEYSVTLTSPASASSVSTHPALPVTATVVSGQVTKVDVVIDNQPAPL